MARIAIAARTRRRTRAPAGQPVTGKIRSIEQFVPLPVVVPEAGAGFAQPTQRLPERVTRESPALEVMTDLRQTSAVLVRASDTVTHARERMRNRGVRMRLCADVPAQVEGMITLADIVGERPIQAAQARGIANAELLVRDIMTPRVQLEARRFDDVAHARVGYVVESLRRAGRQHALVVESGPQQRVRGVFSVSQIARQLGVVLQATEVAHTFASPRSKRRWRAERAGGWHAGLVGNAPDRPRGKRSRYHTGPRTEAVVRQPFTLPAPAVPITRSSRAVRPQYVHAVRSNKESHTWRSRAPRPKRI